MRLLFKQRFFSWFDSYDVYDDRGRVLYAVKGRPSWGHRLVIFNAAGEEIGMVREKVISFLPQFEMYIRGQYIGCIRKDLSIFRPRFSVQCNGWKVKGGVWEWNYEITDTQGRCVARISKELLHWTDTYVIDVADPGNALCALMLVLAIDAEKCTRAKNEAEAEQYFGK